MFKTLYSYRGFILGSVQREFQLKYRNSLLGVLWSLINPLAMILVYTLVFSQVMRTKVPGISSNFGYSIYLCAGIFTWGLFSDLVVRAQNMFLENANMIKKLNFPRICLPVIVITSSLLQFSIIFGLFSLFLILSDNFPWRVYWAIFPLLALLISFATGLGVVLGVLNVFFRDIGHFFNVFLQFWFWFTPVVYPINIIPERFKHLMFANPLVPLVEGFQVILVDKALPNWSSLWLITILSFLLILLALTLFRNHSGEMVDEL